MKKIIEERIKGAILEPGIMAELSYLYSKISSSINLSLIWCLKFLRKNYK